MSAPKPAAGAQFLTLPAPPQRLTPDQLFTALGEKHMPTAQQEKVITAPLKPTLVVAGAGSGKTATMSARVTYLVASGQVDPSQVLGLTFTRKATHELRERIENRLGQLYRYPGWTPSSTRSNTDESASADAPSTAAGPSTAAEAGGSNSQVQELTAVAGEATVATYNSFAGSLVREWGLEVGLETDTAVLTPASSWQIMYELMENWGQEFEEPFSSLDSATELALQVANSLNENLLSVDEARELMADLSQNLKDLRSVRGAAKAIDAKSLPAMTKRIQVLDLVERYIDYKRENSLVDFGDQVALACRIVTDERVGPRVIAQYRDRFKAVLLDEFQDTSVAQTILLSSLFAGCGVVAVGDPNQAIYGWRGASSAALGQFHRHFSNGAGPVLQLSTAWRNDPQILQAANRISDPLRASGQVKVEKLVKRPGVGDERGKVWAARVQDGLAEAELIAKFLAQRWSPSKSMAVLCRTRSQFTPIVAALIERGIPVEVVGLGGLLDVPEVADVRALMSVALDPTSADRLMRLIDLVGIDAADLDVVWSFARDLVNARANTGQSSAEPLLAEALSEIVVNFGAFEAFCKKYACALSPAGLYQAKRLGRILQEANGAANLELVDFISWAERALGLDVEAAARVDVNEVGARALAALRAQATSFKAQNPEAGAQVFLGWLNAAQDQERGLELPEVEPAPGAVQVLTVHASKGLEWDIVVVPGLVEANFPSYRSRPKEDYTVLANSWITQVSEFPHTLRRDYDSLPPCPFIGLSPQAGKDAILAAGEEYRSELGKWEVAEERRLAYVAYTRARSQLLLTTSHYAALSKTPKMTSRFLKELERSQMVQFLADDERDDDLSNRALDQSSVSVWPHQLDALASLEEPGVAEPSVAGPDGAGLSAVAPDQAAPGQAVPGKQAGLSLRLRAAALVSAAGGCQGAGSEEALQIPEGLAPQLDDWWRQARLLLQERQIRQENGQEIVLPSHLAATAMAKVGKEDFIMSLRRPLPPPPSKAARLGTAFHEEMSQRLNSEGTLLSLAEAGSDRLSPADRKQVNDWLNNVADLEILQGYSPYATEIDQEIRLAGFNVRCRIDAVFKAVEKGRAQWLIVDWKTGGQRVRVDQLSLYVHAWAASQNVDISQVRAAYVYVQDGHVDELRPRQIIGLDVFKERLETLRAQH
ncbi:MAG: ATP-dependent helicase [Actinomyces graevenitzii]|nr:ATP-dependent helicase [Actinomyces graevenitzii]